MWTVQSHGRVTKEAYKHVARWSTRIVPFCPLHSLSPHLRTPLVSAPFSTSRCMLASETTRTLTTNAHPSSTSNPAFTSSAASSSSSSSSPSSSPNSQLSAETFPELGGLAPSLLQRLNQLGIAQPTPIQQRVIPFLTRWSHTPLLLQSPTGTGKSLAFLLPLLSKVSQAEQDRRRERRPRTGIHAIIICPTQELAFQTESQLLSLLSSDPEAKADADYLRMCLGGFDEPDVQRSDLINRPPAILIGTPKRLNSVLFPQFETHTMSSRTNAQNRRGHIQVEDHELDDDSSIQEENLQTNEEQGRGEKHNAPNYRSALLDPEYMKRNNIAFAGEATTIQGSDANQAGNGSSPTRPPARRVASSEGNQSFLFSHPSRGVKLAGRTPARDILSDLLYLVVDEADDVLKPVSSRSGEKIRLNRARHPKPSNLLVRALTLLNPAAQLIASSATINGPLRSLIFRLGFKNPRAVHIRIEPRVANAAMQRQAQQHVVEEEISAAQIEAEIRAEEEAEIQPESQQPSIDASSSLSPHGASFPNAITSTGETRPAIPYATAMQYYNECAPNLQHFYVIAPSYYAWRKGQYSEPQEFPHKLEYNPMDTTEKRQAVHEHNMSITHALRRNAFVVDKIASLKLLLHQFQPRCCLLVVDDTAPSAGSKHNPIDMSQLQRFCTMMQIRSTLLFHHLSDPSPQARTKFFQQVEQQKFEVLIAGLSSVRGIDLPLCDLVIHLSPCRNPTDYIHASGRTGRMGKVGSVMTLMHPEELTTFDSLSKFMPETFKNCKQVLLPRIFQSQVISNILKVYEDTAAEREKRGEELNAYVKAKLKKKVREDTPKVHKRS